MAPSIILRSITALSVLIPTSYTAQLTKVPNFGFNPTNIEMNIYVPDKLAAKPAIVMGLHPCGGTPQMYYQMSRFAPFADQHGFILIYPGTPHDMRCWDVATPKTLKHNGGGESQGLVSMVNYTLTKYNADRSKVFVTGGSSGAMMTNVLAGAYPDVFAAGAPYSGGAAGCNKDARGSNPMNFNQACLNGRMNKSAKEWFDLVDAMYPGYKGVRTRMQIWHGVTDNVVRIQALNEMIKQWSGVLDVQWARNVTDDPQRGYTKMVFGDGTKLVAYEAAGVGHIVPMHPEVTLKFFGVI